MIERIGIMEKLTIEVDVKEVWHKLIAKQVENYYDYSQWLEEQLKDRMTADELELWEQKKDEWWKGK